MSLSSLFLLLYLYIITTTCYYLSQKSLSFSNAELYCNTFCNSTLAIIHSIEDSNYINNIILQYNTWIGLSDLNIEGIFKWNDGSILNESILHYTEWILLQHNTSINSTKHCVQINKNNNEWETDECGIQQPFVCNTCNNMQQYDGKYYFLSLNELNWSNSRRYCEYHCNSELISIHNDKQNLMAIDIISNGILLNGSNSDIDNVWIGLYDISGNKEWEWSDNTVYNYGNNESEYPWIDRNELNLGSNCNYIDKIMDYKWNNLDCNIEQKTLCNSCDGKFNKYIGIKIWSDWNTANSLCNTYYGTELASIHSFDDYHEAVLIADIFGDDLWIGLNDKDKETEFIWIDGTSWDFANDITGIKSHYPWYTNNGTNSFNEDCVKISIQYGFKLNDVDCTNKSGYALCNMPSEVCYEKYWNIIKNDGNIEWNGINNNIIKCELDINGGENVLMMNGKQWVNHNGNLRIDFMYNIKNGSNGDCGILIDFLSICQYFYVGINVNNISNYYRLFIGRMDNGNYRELNGMNIIYRNSNNNNNDYYELSINIINGSFFNISIGDEWITYNDNDNDNIKRNAIFSGYIGIYNNNLTINVKSLFISGSKVYLDDDYIINEFTKCPTLIPTINPTINPSIDPTEKSLSINTGINTISEGSVHSTTSVTIYMNDDDDDNDNDEDKEVHHVLFTDYLWLGIIAGFILLLAICCCIWICHRRKKQFNKAIKEKGIDKYRKHIHAASNGINLKLPNNNNNNKELVAENSMNASSDNSMNLEMIDMIDINTRKPTKPSNTTTIYLTTPTVDDNKSDNYNNNKKKESSLADLVIGDDVISDHDPNQDIAEIYRKESLMSNNNDNDNEGRGTNKNRPKRIMLTSDATSIDIDNNNNNNNGGNITPFGDDYHNNNELEISSSDSDDAEGLFHIQNNNNNQHITPITSNMDETPI